MGEEIGKTVTDVRMHLPGGGAGFKRRRKMAESAGNGAGIYGELWWTERVLSEVQAEHPGELVR